MAEIGDPAIVWRFAGAIATIAVVLTGLAYALRAARGPLRAGRAIERCGAMTLGAGAAIHVLRIDGQTLVIGSSSAGVTLLCRLSEAPLPAKGPASPRA